jgi:hypothetical protein
MRKAARSRRRNPERREKLIRMNTEDLKDMYPAYNKA